MDEKKLTIVVIAGGSGKRMQPLITHKTVFPFMGIPLIEYVLKNLNFFPSYQKIIVTNPSVEKEVKAIASRYSAEVCVQKKAKGMAEAILTAKNLISSNSRLLVIDAVTLLEQTAYQEFAKAVKKYPDKIILSGKKITEYKHGGYFKFDQRNNITGIVEKPAKNKLPSQYFKLVLDYFPDSNELVNALQKTKSDNDDLYEVALSSIMSSLNTKLVVIEGSHSSLKYAPKVLDVMNNCLQHYLVPRIDKTAVIHSSATIGEDVYLGKNVKIFENAVIKGLSYIGDNCIIGNGVLVRDSCIENDCEIGFNSEIARSYIGTGTKCHTSFVGDSIIEGNVNLAAGTITANLRFDDKPIVIHLPIGKVETNRRKFGSIIAKGVKTAIHTSLMPGTTIASSTILHPAMSYKGYIVNS